MKRTVTPQELAEPLVPYEEAVERIVGAFAPLPARDIPLEDARELVLGEAIVADRDVPGFASSAMDGYAIRSVDVGAASRERPAELRVVGDLPAGAEPGAALAHGTAAKIMTGGPVPPGADAVVPWEDTQARDGAVAVLVAVPAGKHVRPRGEDLRAGDAILEPGEVLRPVHLGVLASLGRTRVRAHPRPRVAVLSTGEELAPPGGPLGPGQVFDANATLIAAMCEAAGAMCAARGRVGDDPAAIAAWIADAAARADLVVTSGGASVGEHDWIRDVLSREGELALWRVAVKPGKPIAFGRVSGTPVLALPGNPGSAYACTHAFVLRAVRVLAGRSPDPPSAAARLGAAVKGSPSRTSLIRVRLGRGRDGAIAEPLPAQSSVVLSNLIPAEAYAIVPPGGLPADAEVRVELFA